MAVSSQKIKSFQEQILSWYEVNKRSLPWRETKDPYNILISEVMSQQTQMSRVVPKYLQWVRELPSFKSLANAKTGKVLNLWSGLGYNRRAIYLQQAAKVIENDYGGVIPEDEKVIRSLPGIGEYTTAAILCFAFNWQIPVIDTNVKKVVAIEFFQGSIPEKKELSSFVERLLPIGHAYEWNQALMDYAALCMKKAKVIIPKQSVFKGSDRYYRGQIMKILVDNEYIMLSNVGNLFDVPIEKERLDRILQGLQKDKLIKLGKKYILLPE